jgi:hypothetical protein
MQQEKQITLNLTINQLNIVLSGVVKLPIEMGLETFNAIQQQANQQLGAPTGNQPVAGSPISGALANKVI